MSTREGRDVRRGISCLVLLLAAPLARAAEAPGPGPAELQGKMKELRALYLSRLGEGERDDELRNLIRDLNAARNSGDWDRVRRLLGAYEALSSPAGGKGLVPESTGLPGLDELLKGKGEEDSAGAAPGFTMEKAGFESPMGTGVGRIGALVYKPAQLQQRNPAIVLVHSGARGVPIPDRKLAEALVKVGYIVYVPELRGRGSSDGKREVLGGEVLDVLAAVVALKQMEGADAKRIGLVGTGLGGTIALLALARVEVFACAAAISPAPDLESLLREVPEFRRYLKGLRPPFSLEDAEALRARSPIYSASGISAPLLVLHGRAARRVPLRFVEGLKSVLERKGKDITLETYLLAGDDLPEKLALYHVDLQNFLARRLRPPGWKIQKKGGRKGGGRSGERRRRY